MEKERKSVINWIKEHKTQLIIAGVSITAILAVVIGIKNRQALEEAWMALRKLVEKAPEKTLSTCKVTNVIEDVSVVPVAADNIVPITRIPHNVSEHVRNFPTGYKPSAEKLALAAERGLVLLPGQTIVEAYSTGGVVA